MTDPGFKKHGSKNFSWHLAGPVSERDEADGQRVALRKIKHSWPQCSPMFEEMMLDIPQFGCPCYKASAAGICQPRIRTSFPQPGQIPADLA